jgi:hypothetical protein
VKYLYDEQASFLFSQISYPEKISQYLSDYYYILKELPRISLILDEKVFNALLCDIHYFHSIYWITDEDKEVLKNELYALIDYLSEIANKGCWSETGKNVSLYISQINIDSNYNYFHYDNETKVCSVQTFGENAIYSTDTLMTNKFRAWMQIQKRASVQISQSNEKNRIEFFKKQRLLVDAL